MNRDLHARLVARQSIEELRRKAGKARRRSGDRPEEEFDVMRHEPPLSPDEWVAAVANHPRRGLSKGRRRGTVKWPLYPSIVLSA